MEIVDRLSEISDKKYAEFALSLLPKDTKMLGVRLPVLRAFARELQPDWREVLTKFGIVPLGLPKFISESGDRYFEEDMLCGILLSQAKSDFDEISAYIRGFAPRIKNWSVCDSTFMGMKIFSENREKAWELIRPYFSAEGEYFVRFAVVSAMAHFAKDEWTERVFSELKVLSDGKLNGKYYAQTAVAWAYATFYAEFPDLTRTELDKISDKTILKKSVAKIIESLRISDYEKEALRKKYNYGSKK